MANPDVLPAAAPIPSSFLTQGNVPVVPAEPDLNNTVVALAPPAPPVFTMSPANPHPAAPPRPEPLPEDLQGDNPEGAAGSKFLSKTEAARLLAMHGLINSYLNIDGIDKTHVDVKDAKVDEKKGLVMTLGNGHELICGKHPDGSEYIGLGGASGPMTQADAAAGASLCKSRGWTEINVNAPSEEERALMAIEAQKQGLKVLNPPANDIMEKVRKELEAAARKPGAQQSDAPAAASPAAQDDNYGRTTPGGKTFLGEPVADIEKWNGGKKFDEIAPFDKTLAAASLKAHHFIDGEVAPADKSAAVKDFKTTLDLLVKQNPKDAASFCASVLDHAGTGDLKAATQSAFKDALTDMVKTDPAGARKFAAIQLETRGQTPAVADVIKSIPALATPPAVGAPRARAPVM